MNILITGGNTQIPIDQVRVISNIFKGRTACDLANYMADQGHKVTLLGNPEMVKTINELVEFQSYKTYDDLYTLMKSYINDYESYDCIIHSAAVSDYFVSGVLDSNHNRLDNKSKIKSTHDTLYLELKPTRKIVDDIRGLWGYKGVLVKFKLQVGMSDEELLKIARESRKTSQADIIVANCLEWAKDRAFIIGERQEDNVSRQVLPISLLRRIKAVLN